ncbi:hypothetical protein ACTHO0_06985 [Cytobacillus praedii]
MKKWVLSAIAYLLVVVGGYYTYEAVAGSPVEDPGHSDTEQHEK